MARRRVYLFGIGGPGYGRVTKKGVPLGGGPSKRRVRYTRPATMSFTTSGLLPRRKRRR